MLGAAETDPFRPKITRHLGIGTGVGIGAHAQFAPLICPGHQGLEIITQLGFHRGGLAEQNAAGRAIDSDPLALAQGYLANVDNSLAIVDF